MKNFKKVLNLSLILVMSVLICFTSLTYAMADDVNNIDNKDNQPNVTNDCDPNDYDENGAILDRDMNSDDFDYEDKDPTSFANFANSTSTQSTALIDVRAQKNAEELPPERIIYMKAKKAYTVTGLKHKLNIQCSYVATGYIFVSQSNSDGVTYLSRCELKGTTATYKDEMKLVNFGHNQTLKVYSHNNKTYFLIGCKSNQNGDKNNKKYGFGLTIQVGRIQYKAGTTISNYTQVNRIVRLDCANTSGKGFNTLTESEENNVKIKSIIKRMDASLSSNKKYLVLAVRSIHEDIQYSYYDFEVINNLLDKVEGKSPNYISCYNNTSIKNACKFSCIQKYKNRILPNGSCQGIDFTNAYSIYMSGGAGTSGEINDNGVTYYNNYIPKIAKMVKKGNSYTYSLCVRITNTYTSKEIDNNTTLDNYYMEIEGIQNTTDYLYFVLAPARVPNNSTEKSTTQYIYSLSKNEIDEKASQL